MAKKPAMLSIERFHEAAKEAAEPLLEAGVQHSFETEVKASETDDRSLIFTISTATVDRMGDTIAVDGWKLDSFRKNPVVLWGHDASSLPVARASKVWIEGGKLKADAQFTPPGMARFNDTVFDMLKAKFLNATSVGFQPLKYAFTDDPQRRFGIDFLEQELLEFSVVSIPANPEALVEARSAGIDIEPMIEAFTDQILKTSEGEKLSTILERLAAKCGMAIVSKTRIESIERAATAQRLKAARDRRNRDLDLVRVKSF